MNTKRIVAIAICVGLSACNHSITGTLTVPAGQTLTLIEKGTNAQVSVPGGSSAVVTMGSGKLILSGFTNSNGQTVEIDGNKDLFVAFDSVGDHTFSASQTGQPVDIEEITQNQEYTSRDFDGVQQCVYSVTVPVECAPPPPPPGNNPPPPVSNPPGKPGDPGKPGPGGPGGPGRHAMLGFKNFGRTPAQADGRCTTTILKTGSQRYVYHYEADAFGIQLVMKTPSTAAQNAGTVVGMFDGHRYDKNPVTTWTSDCYSMDRQPPPPPGGFHDAPRPGEPGFR